jgi:murein DD-endopeptidase MepM/ murein hydrolase activator NlpD
MKNTNYQWAVWSMILLGLITCSALADEEVAGQAGGGSRALATSECVATFQRQQGQALSVNQSLTGGGGPGPSGSGDPEAYPFVPIAGTEWQDRFINNFVDLNPSFPGILDWGCTDFTYDGHQGHDIDLRSFGEQDIGVPVFAALDGTVSGTHDGEFDRNTQALGQPANYVILQHAGTHYSWYWHLRQNSVAVTNGQFVRAGTQIGLAASSGNSTGPHLHFESRNNGLAYEPSAGPCRPGPSYWVNQDPIRRDTWIADFAMHNTNSFPANAWLPFNPTRRGTIVRTGGFQPIGAWYIIHNQPAASTWRVRYLRPNATSFFDSGNQNYQSGGNPFYRYASWWVYYNLNPDVAGTWNFELSVNGQNVVQAPFLVLNAGGVVTNRAPNAITASFDPAVPTTNDVVFCRLNVPLLADPDFDLMRYRFVWSTNGQTMRAVTNAAFSDAIPRRQLRGGDLLSCVVTPFDGQAFGVSVTNQVIIPGGQQVQLRILNLSPNQVSIRWPTSYVNYALESSTNFVQLGSWTAVTNAVSIEGNETVVTNQINGSQRFYRLRWP